MAAYTGITVPKHLVETFSQNDRASNRTGLVKRWLCIVMLHYTSGQWPVSSNYSTATSTGPLGEALRLFSHLGTWVGSRCLSSYSPGRHEGFRDEQAQ